MEAVGNTTEEELIALLKDELDGEEEANFIDGFRAYLEYDARNDFVVTLMTYLNGLASHARKAPRRYCRNISRKAPEAPLAPLASTSPRKPARASCTTECRSAQTRVMKIGPRPYS